MKYYITILLLSVLSLQGEDGLTHHWKFNHAIQDEITQNNPEVVGDLQYADGIFKSSLVFNGALGLFHKSGIEKLQEFSITAWVKSHEDRLHGRILEKGASNSFWLYAQNGKIAGGFFDGENYQDVSTAEPIAYNNWHMVTLTYDSQYIRLYINGDEESNMLCSLAVALNEEPFAIGTKYKGIKEDNFVGLIDDLRFYKKALSPKEVEVLFDSSGYIKTNE
jgi:hypothetical protein